MDRERVDRRRIEDLEDAVQVRPGVIEQGEPALLVKTATKDTYPTTAKAWYWCTIRKISGEPAEGVAPTITDTSEHLWAWNRGGAIPPSGTERLANAAGGYWTIEYSG